MKNRDHWRPSKYVFKKGRLRASRDPAEVGVGSRLTADLIAAFYQEYLPRYARGRLLDLGCGMVPMYAVYRDHVTESVCVDWSDTQHPNQYLDHECDLSRDLPFDGGAFDTIILSDVLEHLPEPAHTWREIARVLTPGGIVFVNVPFYYCLHERPHDYYRYTEFALRRFVENARLELVLLRAAGGTPEILADILAKHFQFVPVIGKPLAMAIQAVTRYFVGTRPGAKLSRKTAEAFPFGYFLIARKGPA